MARRRRRTTTHVQGHVRARRLHFGHRAASALALTFVLIAGTAAAERSGAYSGSVPDVSVAAPAPISFAMAVKPGSPVPMRIVTEQSSGELVKKGYAGKGIDVALIDTGVTPVSGLDQPGKIVYGPDLSVEGGQSDLVNLDTYGHGTHLAGIINGNGDEVLGIAPDSRIVSVKVAGATGETSIAQVIAAIDWVVEHKNDNGLNIRILNLSLGMPGIKTSQGDPLSAAVERAWHAGIVVVAAAGNRGSEFGGIDSPAVSPYVIAVGAHESYDSSGAQDWIAPWSSGGNEYRQPDVVAPGRSIMSFRVPGSTLDRMYPSAVVGERYFVGSGTSQSAAVVSGFAAAVLSRDPSLTPDQIKFLLEKTAKDFKNVPSYIDGFGKVSAKDVAKNTNSAAKAPVQVFTPALSAQGSDGITTPSGARGPAAPGTVLRGPAAPGRVLRWSGATWSGATWSGATWSGATWSGATWSGATWSGATWSGVTWSSLNVSGKAPS